MPDASPAAAHRFDCTRPGTERDAGLRAAVTAVRAGELIVLPTDTVYGIGADAFAAPAVRALLAAKGRGRDSPPPVLIADRAQLADLVDELPTVAEALLDAFWPGALTLVVNHSAAIAWDLGERHGTVAVRVPDHQVARELLAATGPLAVSSANLHGKPPAATATDAVDQLGDSVAVYLDAGPAGEPVPSTIVDVTAATPTVLRHGALTLAELRAVAPTVTDPRP
jgi:L-threonylcarbamoyladenylate synthase